MSCDDTVGREDPRKNSMKSRTPMIKMAALPFNKGFSIPVTGSRSP